MDRTWGRLGRLLADRARAAAAAPRSAPRTRRRPPARPAPPDASPAAAGPDTTGSDTTGPDTTGPDTAAYAGDFTGTARVEYAPAPDGRADPGEVVWGWVPFEEDHSRGKDRPALVVGRDGRWVLALMLTSRDHDADPKRQGRPDEDWLDVGTGGWDSRRRPSEVRLDRVLRLDPDGIRREGSRMELPVFEQVACALRDRYGWT